MLAKLLLLLSPIISSSFHLPTHHHTFISHLPAIASGRNIELPRPNNLPSIVFDAYFGDEARPSTSGTTNVGGAGVLTSTAAAGGGTTGANTRGKEVVVYLPCLSKTKNNAKASNLEMWCKRTARSFVSADYLGVGRSGGVFEDGGVGRWASDTIFLLDELRRQSPTLDSDNKFVLVGGGVGGWVSVLVGIKRPDLVRGVVGLASDPDFTEDLLWKTFDEETKEEIMEKGSKTIDWGSESYPISRTLIEDGRENLVLRGGKNSLPLDCPVRLLHSISDEEVPYTTALKLADCIASDDTVVILPTEGCHQLDDEGDFFRMRRAVEDVLEAGGGFDLRSPGSG